MEKRAGIFSRLDTVCLRVRDIQKSKAWYVEKLELSPVYVDDEAKLVVFDLGGTSSFTIYQLQDNEKSAPAGTAGTFPIFLSESAEQSHKLLRERGVETDPIQEGTGVRFFSFYDPDGNRLEACEVAS
jgi:catechol 2,3-dioxygenase-like lactoylglutathione lyase family enzyme